MLDKQNVRQNTKGDKSDRLFKGKLQANKRSECSPKEAILYSYYCLLFELFGYNFKICLKKVCSRKF